MDFSNDGGSVYHRLLALYLRTSEGDIIRSVGQQSKSFETIWPSIEAKVIESSRNCPTSDVIIPKITIDDDSSDIRSVCIIEQPTPASTDIIGIVMIVKDDCSHISEFTKLFARIVISRSVLKSTESNTSDETENVTQSLTDLFDSHLRFESRNDKWVTEGREYFAERVRYFVSRNLRIDACLPAFPCKSSNPEKVSGDDPDKGEELALRRIHNFVQEVEKIYTPGACIWVVSDGHVFSDCIGVDDTTVDTYGEKLQDMNEKISEELGSDKRVCFRSLIDIFDLQSHIDDLRQTTQDFDIPEIDHHIDSELTDEAEVSRQILIAGCAPDPGALRNRIKSDEKSIVALYRGFSRFMLEDLSLHPAAENLSKKKRKKLAEKVSFEMIQRNQAYSNLIEMVFPDHIRLSIHAHNNAGPKFGIQLFDTDMVRATDDLAPDSLKMSTDDLLHIPTPWHNCIAQVAGHPVLHVVKSKNVEEVLDDKTYDGGYVEGDIDEGKGGFFSLKDLTGTLVKEPVDECATHLDSLDLKGNSSHSSMSSGSVVSEDSSSNPDTAPDMDECSSEEVLIDTKKV